MTGGSAGGHLSLLIGLDSDQGDPTSDDAVMRSQNSVAAVVAVSYTHLTLPTNREV